MLEEKDIQKGTGRSDGNTESHQLRACKKFFDMRKDVRAGELNSILGQGKGSAQW